jgi:ent-kaurene oxidase
MADGTQLARGSTIALALEPLNLSPHIYPNPDVFDGLRHYRLQRQNAGSDLRGSYQFTSINKTSVNFGYGRHSCPGRYLASEMIKVAVAMILLECDIKFEEGKDRPKNIKLDTFIAPDHSARLLIRRRRT